MKQYIKSFFPVWLIVCFIAQVFFNGSLLADEEDYYYRLKKSWLHMRRVYEQLNQHYVEEMDPYPLIKAGIDGMLDELDPYTVFIEEDGERRLQIITTGRYGGLGMEIGLRNKKVTVIAPIDNSPAKRVGIRAGDVIEKIDGQNISSWGINKVSGHLRGKIGTKIDLVIKRPGLDKKIELTLTREEIIIKDIGYSGFLQPGVAYLSLTGFTDKAASEMIAATKKLQKEGEIKQFILDLRGNPGGLLKAAVDVVNVFVPKGELVVYTKGFREKEYKFHTENEPLLADVPLAVLVNGGSASASEIVAGALQDLDRAVIIGKATYGKGLVQKVYPIDDKTDTKVKITTAKYYVPSGRCIQKKDYGLDNDVFARDSLSEKDNGSHLYYTRNKREVYDKGGIYPDISVNGDSINYVLIDLLRKSLIFDFAVEYHQNHSHWDGDYAVTDSLLDAFRLFLDKRGFESELVVKDEIARIEKVTEQNNYSDEIGSLLNQLKNKFEEEKIRDYENSREQIRKILRLELAEKYYGSDKRDQMALEADKQTKKAIEILLNSKNYTDILAGK